MSLLVFVVLAVVVCGASHVPCPVSHVPCPIFVRPQPDIIQPPRMRSQLPSLRQSPCRLSLPSRSVMPCPVAAGTDGVSQSLRCSQDAGKAHTLSAVPSLVAPTTLCRSRPYLSSTPASPPRTLRESRSRLFARALRGRWWCSRARCRYLPLQLYVPRSRPAVSRSRLLDLKVGGTDSVAPGAPAAGAATR